MERRRGEEGRVRKRERQRQRLREREREKREKRKEDTTRRKPVINNVCMCVRIYMCVHGKKSERYVLYERDTAKATKKVGRWSVS